MCFRSAIAVAVVYAGSYSPDWTPSLGTYICHRCSPKKNRITEVCWRGLGLGMGVYEWLSGL